MPLPIFVVDAFTVNKKPFTGNPAGVCLLEYDDDITDEHKQKIAMQMNLSETAFVSSGWTKGNKLSNKTEGSTARTLRWFTPTNEVPLCGHATVASAKVLSEIHLDGRVCKINFESKFRGQLGATLEKDGSICLDFPSNPTHILNHQDPKEKPWMMDMLQKTLGDSSNSIVKDVHYSPGTKILLIRIKDELKVDGLGRIKPNFQGMLDIDTGGFVHDIIVTVKGELDGNDPDFYSRFFASWDGIDEDPVTGLAHTVLTPFWTKELENLKRPLKARQHSDRGGDLECTLVGDRVKISGQARIGLKGQLFI